MVLHGLAGEDRRRNPDIAGQGIANIYDCDHLDPRNDAGASRGE